MGDADLALQAALYVHLGSDETLAGLVGTRLYDNAPGDAHFPYLALGDAEIADWSDGETQGCEHRLSFHALSRNGGRAEAKAIMGAVHGALHDRDLTLAGHRLVNLRFERAETRRESDGATWRGTIRFRAVTEKINA
jgi:hypothetical protein